MGTKSKRYTELGWVRPLWVVPLAATAHVAGQALASIVLASSSLERPNLPHAVGMGQLVAWGWISSAFISLGVAPLSRWLRGGLFTRWLVLSAFIFLVNKANAAIEMTIFTTIGGQAYLAASGVLPALLCAGVLVAIPPVRSEAPSLADDRSSGGLAWRLAVGWLAFPTAYLIFGMLIAPLVIDSYLSDESMLIVPPMGTILGVQAIRSVLFLLPTLAVIERWTGNRLGLWLALGWSHWALVGLAGLVMPNELLSVNLRLVHSLEIGAASFAYTGIMVAVLAAGCSPGGLTTGAPAPRIAGARSSCPGPSSLGQDASP